MQNDITSIQASAQGRMAKLGIEERVIAFRKLEDGEGI